MVLDDENSDKTDKFHELLELSFVPSLRSKQYIHNFLEKEFFPKLRTVLDTFLKFLDKPINSRKELSDVFSKQNDYIYLLSTQDNTLLYFRFIKGSMIYMQTCIMTCCSRYTDEKMRSSFISDALKEMEKHFEFLYKELIEKYDSPSKV
jgi:hypothetical protein